MSCYISKHVFVEITLTTKQPLCCLYKYKIAVLVLYFDCVLSPEENAGLMEKIEQKMKAGGHIKVG